MTDNIKNYFQMCKVHIAIKKLTISVRLKHTILCCIAYSVLSASGNYCGRPYSAFVGISLEGASKTDTMVMSIMEMIISETSSFTTPKIQVQSLRGQDGIFRFYLPDSIKKGYFSIHLKNAETSKGVPSHLLNTVLFEAEDSFFVEIKKNIHFEKRSRLFKFSTDYSFKIYDYSFSGRGYEKALFYYLNSKQINTKSPHLFDWLGNFNTDNYYDFKLSQSLSLLDSLKPGLSDYAKGVLAADLIGKIGIEKYQLLVGEYIRKSGSVNRLERQEKIRDKIGGLFQTDTKWNFPEEVIFMSQWYADFFVSAAYTYCLIAEGTGKSGVYRLLKEIDNPTLKDKTMTVLLLENYSKLKDSEALLKEVIAACKTPYFKKILYRYQQNMAKGQPAYNFSLPNLHGETVRLSDFNGKVVFIDFWYTGCAPCAGYYQKELSIVESKFKHNDKIVFITISVDDDKIEWAKSINSGKYTSPEVINLFTEGKGYSHPVIQHYRIAGFPWPLLIGPSGDIVSTDKHELRSAENLERAINKEIQKINN